MKAITNRIKRHPDGFMSVRMQRPAPNGRSYRYMLWISPAEQKNGRDYLAGRIRKARAVLSQSLTEIRK